MSKKRKPGHAPPAQVQNRFHFPFLSGKYQPYLPALVSGLFFSLMLYGVTTFHRMGNYGPETDFYIDHIPTAEKLYHGQFSVWNYPLKGPLYSVVMVTGRLFGVDYYTSAQMVNLVCSSLILFLLYHLVAKVFHPVTAAFALGTLATNFIFIQATYEVGYDVLFLFFNLLALFYFFRKGPVIRNLFIAGFLSALGFLTRYNGFILVGLLLVAILFVNVFSLPWSERYRKAAGYLAGFFILVSPWMYLSYRETGSLIYNRNWRTMAAEFYVYGKGWKQQYGEYADKIVDQKMHSFGDLVREDPKYFFSHILSNIGRNIKNDVVILNTLPIAILSWIGFFLSFFHKINKKQFVFYLYGVFNLLILTLVLYEPRYFLTVLLAYLPLAFYSFSTDWFRERVSDGLRKVVYILLAGLVIYSGTRSVLHASTGIKQAPMYLLNFADWLKKNNPDPEARIIARKPHIGYLSGLVCEGYSSFPTDIRTHEALLKHAREKRYQYLLYSEIEASLRPEYRYLLNAVIQNQKFEGMTLVYYNQHGLLFRFDPAISK